MSNQGPGSLGGKKPRRSHFDVQLNADNTLVAETDPSEVGNGGAWFLGSRKQRPESHVTAFIQTADYYAALGEAIRKTGGPSDFIFIVGWELGLDTPLGGRTLEQLLVEASDGRGVAVRAMLYANLLRGRDPDNQSEVLRINRLKNGGAIHDNRYLNLGSHHQKFAVVQNPDQLVAFVGGMDVHPSRLNWHDVQCHVEGPGAVDLHQTFTERWADHPHTGRDPSDKERPTNPVLPLLGSKALTPAGVMHTQVVRTYGNGRKHSGLAIPQSDDKETTPALSSSQYAFAPDGERSMLNLLVRAIGEAKRFIYIEDQYLVSSSPSASGIPPYSDILASKVREGGFKKLVILVARTEAIQGELKQAWKRRRDFVAKISSPDPSKVVVCQYKTKPGALVDLEQPRFVHSKTTIFDDRFAVIGSANCNRRGHTHDSECGIGVFDENPKADRLLFAHDLRIRLWMKHLDAAGQNLRVRDFLDPIASARFWEQPSKNAPVELYDVDGDTRQPPAARNPGPDGRVTASAAGVGGFIGKGIDALLPLRLKNADDDWNILLDPDGA